MTWLIFRRTLISLFCIIGTLNIGILPTVLPRQACAQTSPTDSLLRSSLLRSGVSAHPEGRVEVFAQGTTKFDDLLHVIDRAQHHIHIEYFIFADDSIAHTVLAHLRQKAAQGVEVRLVIDDYKAVCRHYGYDKTRVQQLRAEGIDVRMFAPFRFPYVHRLSRDHRKIVVVDGRVGYIGGLNVSDYYLTGDPDTYGEWRDTHVRITGEAVEVLQRYFAESFTKSGGAPFDGADYYPYTAQQGVADISYFDLPEGDLPASGITFVERSKQHKAQMRRAFESAFNSAQRKLLIVSPYFLPTAGVRRALIRAIDRGVDVHILLSHDSDEPLLLAGNLNFARRLIRHGAHVYLYRGGFHHSKILMVDDSYSMVGSANLNSRSLRWDYEASCFIYSPEVTARLTEIFNNDLSHSDIFTDSLYHTLSRATRLKGSVVNHVLTPFL
jgi:cardiolipin synthase